MKLIHLSMKKHGIRFFSKFSQYLSEDLFAIYEKYYGRGGFLNRLQTTESTYDMVLISAHGSACAIIMPIKPYDPTRRFKPYIRKEDTTAFVNKFVFAISC